MPEYEPENEEDEVLNKGQDALYIILSNAVDRALDEWELTEVDVIGILEILKLDTFNTHRESGDDSDSEDEDTDIFG